MNIERKISKSGSGQPGSVQPSFPDERRPSWQSRLIVALLRLKRVKRRLATADAVRAEVRRLAATPLSHAPTGLGSGVEVTMRRELGWPVYRTAPTTGRDTGNHVMFLHGGGFVDEIVRAHWQIIGLLTREAGTRCVVPIYPLLPHATAAELVPTTGELLQTLLWEAGQEKVSVVGNSAGANLALAAAQWLRDSGYRQPRQLILISPGLDFSLSDPDQPAIAARDPLNDIPGTRELGRLYAGGLGVDHPYVSPLKGDMRGLAPMTVFTGSLDLLYPDSIALAGKARAAGVPVALHLCKGQPHNYAGMPTPEGREARDIIVRALT